MMLSFPRPKTPPPFPPHLRRHVTVNIPITSEKGQNRHLCSCRGAAAVVPSIWHAITPSSGCAAASRAAPKRRWRGVGAEEGSWNAAWDARPARWLHGSDSAWLLFGVCSCYSPVRSGGGDEVAMEMVAGETAGEEGKPVEDYKLIGMSADGRCLFRAVAYGACLATGKDAPDTAHQKELADNLRANVVDELIKRRNEIERFIEEDFDVYIERIRQPYVWGGEPELVMASHVLQIPLSVFMLDTSSRRLIRIANYGEEYKKHTDISIKVLFHGYGHYDALEIAGDC